MSSEPTKPSKIPGQKDQGYDESHGYGPGHGGPSGPGDAPADPALPVKNPPDPSEDETDDAPLP
jgi:hypothetical protein